MLIPKRKIPRVAVASLIAGAGCEDSNAEDLAQLICRSMSDCEPVSFSYAYASMEECTSELSAEFEYYYAYYVEYYGLECTRAIFDYYACYYEHLRAPLCSEAVAENECIEEIFAYYDACD